jgi:hypothetical protein
MEFVGCIYRTRQYLPDARDDIHGLLPIKGTIDNQCGFLARQLNCNVTESSN